MNSDEETVGVKLFRNPALNRRIPSQFPCIMFVDLYGQKYVPVLCPSLPRFRPRMFPISNSRGYEPHTSSKILYGSFEQVLQFLGHDLDLESHNMCGHL